LLLKVPGKDSLGRVNPTVSRIRLRAALLKATERAMVWAFTGSKFASNREVLVATRKRTRDALKDADEALWATTDDLRNIDKWINQVGM